MANDIYTITLADGTKLEGLTMNGDMFRSKSALTAEDFADKLGHVVIEGNPDTDETGIIGTHLHMQLLNVAHYTQAKHGLADGWYFALREIPANEFEALKARSDIDYIAMMTGVTL